MADYSTTSIIDLASIVANHLSNHGIRVVLVGGLAVEIYSENLYLTKDIDMVDISYTPPKALQTAMVEIDFTKQGRVYINPTTDICIEFPSAPLSVGDELIQETTTVDTRAGSVPILLAKDVIKDRLSAYFHWKDNPSLVQALSVMSKHPFSEKELKQFCSKEGDEEAFGKINALRARIKQTKITKMSDIEQIVIEQNIRDI